MKTFYSAPTKTVHLHFRNYFPVPFCISPDYNNLTDHNTLKLNETSEDSANSSLKEKAKILQFPFSPSNIYLIHLTKYYVLL